MRPLFRDMRNTILALVLVLSPALAEATFIGYTTPSGTQWLQLTDTLGVSQEELAALCTPVCGAGSLGSVTNAQGLVWATSFEVRIVAALMMGAAHPSPYDQYMGGYGYVDTMALHWFTPNCSLPQYACWVGYAADSAPGTAFMYESHEGMQASPVYLTATTPSFQRPYGRGFTLDLSPPHVGAWLYQPAAVPTPEPGSLILLGTGIAALGYRRWRR